MWALTGAVLPSSKNAAAAPAGLALGAGFLMIFLILAAQYEKWSLPFSVYAGPAVWYFWCAGCGLFAWVSPTTFISRLVWSRCWGLSAKNAILIVEFATVLVHEGLTPVAAALEACAPALQADFDDLTGLHSGGGTAGVLHRVRVLRHVSPSAPGVLGGMLAATFLAVFLVPLFFKLVNDWNFQKHAR